MHLSAAFLIQLAIQDIAEALTGEKEELDKPIEESLRNKAKKHITIEKEAKIGDYYIDTLCVKPAYWGKRMGTMLVEAIEQKAMKNNYHSISLNVEKDNFKAQRLYAYLGYEPLETITINRHEYDYMVKTLHKGGERHD